MTARASRFTFGASAAFLLLRSLRWRCTRVVSSTAAPAPAFPCYEKQA